MIQLSKDEAKVIIEVLNEYPQNITWSIKGINISKLRERLIEETREKANAKP